MPRDLLLPFFPFVSCWASLMACLVSSFGCRGRVNFAEMEILVSVGLFLNLVSVYDPASGGLSPRIQVCFSSYEEY
jgi:hypothetical protein